MGGLSGTRPGGALPGDGIGLVDPTSPAYWQDTHGTLAPLRERWPVVRSTAGDFEVLRHAHVDALLRDLRLRQALHEMLANQGIDRGPLFDWWQHLMNAYDPPEHTRLRSLVGRAFTPRQVARLRPRIRAIAHGRNPPRRPDRRRGGRLAPPHAGAPRARPEPPLRRARHHQVVARERLWTLASHPAELARLRRDPDLVPTAVEEIARYETPIPSIPRIATVDLEPLLDRPEWTAYVSTRRVAALPARVRVARRAG